MKFVIRLFTFLASLAGISSLVWLSNDNRQMRAQIERLEAELGRMPIDDPNRVYLVEIVQPNVPPEVASHVERLWQFRCYLPPNYNVIRTIGGGEVTQEGCYLSGGTSSNWNSPQAEATHKLLTVSFQRKDERVEAFYSYGNSWGTSSWNPFFPDRMDQGLVVQKLVSSEQGPRSFDQDTILPLLKIFDPTTAEDKQVGGQTITTYAGGLLILCPQSRESEFKQLTQGETPTDFDPRSIATVLGDE